MGRESLKRDAVRQATSKTSQDKVVNGAIANGNRTSDAIGFIIKD